MKPRPFFAAIVAVVVLAMSATILAADVVELVPPDALGFIVVNKLGAVDAKANELLKTLHGGASTPGAFLAAITGIEEGVDPNGSALLAALPSNGSDFAPKFCIWLPVADYDRMLAAAGAPGRDGISEFRLGQEHLLIARHGDWALLMDVDERKRMSAMLSASPTPIESLKPWKGWFNENDIVAVALKRGARAGVRWAAGMPKPGGDDPVPIEEVLDGAAEGENPAPKEENDRAAAKVYGAIHHAVREWIISSPMFGRALIQADAAGVAVRIDEHGNALASTRVLTRANAIGSKAGNPDAELPNSLYEGGEFLYYGAGSFPLAISVGTEWFIRSAAKDLKTQQRLNIDDDRLRTFSLALKTAMADISSFAVVKQPGGAAEGIVTNDFVIVRVPSAKTFVEKATEAMRLWNTMNREAKGGEPLIFDVKDFKMRGRDVVQYSLDVVGAEAQLLPETRKAMEDFFGSDRKLQLWIAPVDDETVIFASATTKEIAVALVALDRKQPINWDIPPLAETNKLMPTDSDWRFYLNPRRQQSWLERRSEAISGPVFGGRQKRKFPPSPPIGFAGSTDENEIATSIVVPAATIKAAGEFLKPAAN